MFRRECRLILAALAVFRLAMMLAGEDGPLHIFRDGRRAVGRWAAPMSGNSFSDEARLSFAELVNCPYCLGVWLAVPALWLALRPSKLGDLVLGWLGLSGAQALLQGRR
jgi:hypothetical protein